MIDRLEALEMKVAWLEQANAELSDVVNRQRLEIEALSARLVTMKDRFDAAQQAPTAYTLEDEKPPHY